MSLSLADRDWIDSRINEAKRQTLIEIETLMAKGFKAMADDIDARLEPGNVEVVMKAALELVDGAVDAHMRASH